MCIQMKRSGRPTKYYLTALEEVGDTITIKGVDTRAQATAVRQAGVRVGKKVKTNRLVRGGARVELVSFIEGGKDERD